MMESDGGVEKSDSQTDDSTPADFDTFLEENQSKFAIMGIFGTVSLFISGLGPDTQDILLQIGTVASLAIFSLSAIHIVIDSTKELRRSRGSFPKLDELSYSTLSVCTVALLITVVVWTLQFQEAIQLIVELILLIIVVLLSTYLYPEWVNNNRTITIEGNEYPTDPIGKTLDAIITPTSCFISYLVAIQVYGIEIGRHFEGLYSLDQLFLLPVIVLFFLFLFLTRESLIGVVLIVSSILNIGLKSAFSNPWKIRTSLIISYAMSGILTWAVLQHVPEGVGYYSIRGTHWEIYTLSIFSVIGVLYFAILTMGRGMRPTNGAKRFCQVVAIIFTAVIIYEIFITVPNGIRVISV
ncbi:hypothetical protein OB955_09290 [Halobacteria archaeon AArc-m2/3/4]|uniref:Uncharacterized protein n=1 Tax=Natronoglomus mannanivorans TaxID=2979990 RepID=A0ABT2QDG3_9EURY|nr:hypothetical protein [Halobacteria archaeon AArc-m2/3/4]